MEDYDIIEKTVIEQAIKVINSMNKEYKSDRIVSKKNTDFYIRRKDKIFEVFYNRVDAYCWDSGEICCFKLDLEG